MKRVLIVRHGTAVNVGEKGVRRDTDRMLTLEGRERTRKAALGLRRLDCRPALVVASPLVRAMETAEILADTLEVELGVRTFEAIGSPIEMDEAISWLRSCTDFPVMLVGHMPGLSDLASRLLSGSSSAAFAMKKDSVTCIAFDGKPVPGAGTLEWFIPPKALRSLGRRD